MAVRWDAGVYGTVRGAVRKLLRNNLNAQDLPTRKLQRTQIAMVE
jgi:hypothetical protein